MHFTPSTSVSALQQVVWVGFQYLRSQYVALAMGVAEFILPIEGAAMAVFPEEMQPVVLGAHFLG